MKAAKLRELAALAEAKRARDLARLDALIAEARGIEEAIAALSGTERRDMAEGRVPFALMGMRVTWADAEIAARRARLQAIAAELAAVRAEARVSLGKHEALRALVAQAERAEHAERERTEEVAALVGRAARGGGSGPGRGGTGR
jgi:hypothetical protein